MGRTITASADEGGAADVPPEQSQAREPQRGARHGLEALCLIARLHHVAADAEQLAHQLGWPPSHVPSMQDLLLAAKHLGLKAKRSRASLERLPLVPLPALAVLKTEDGSPKLVVLAQCDGQRVLFQDPSGAIQGGRPTIEPLEVFAAQWSGELILITSRASLAGELAKFDFSWFIPSIVKYRRLLGEVLIVSLFLQLFALVSPLFFQVVMDKVLVHRGLTTLDVLVIGLIVVVLFESVLTVLRSYTFSHTTSRIDVELGARLFRHLLSLPLAYFQSRRVGDSVARVRELENIRSFLTGNALTLVLDVVFSVIFIAMMLAYSVPLTLIVLVSLPLYLGLSLTVVPILRARLNEKFARGAENQALLVETVTGIQTVKASALEPAIARRWDQQLAAYVVDNAGDVTTEAASGGTDTVESSITWTLGAEIEKLTLTGTTSINGTGNTLANTLTGNSAANRLDGGTGADTMIGGAGNDIYVVDNIGDVTTEAASGGTDTVESCITWTLGSELENLTLTGTGAINGTGNALDNVLAGNGANNSLTGGAGNDTLDGGAGNDTMLGGAGHDTYVVNVTTDVVTENANEGTDTVQSAVTWTLGNNLENLTLTGTTAINGTGNTLANVLTGNSAANNLSGGTGNDTLDGGAGSDTLVGGAGADLYRFGRGYGTDTIQENDSTAGVTDVVQFASGISSTDLSFIRVGNNLEVTIAGATDKLVLKDWYLGTQYRIEQFKLADGTIVTDAQVQTSLAAGPTSSALRVTAAKEQTAAMTVTAASSPSPVARTVRRPYMLGPKSWMFEDRWDVDIDDTRPAGTHIGALAGDPSQKMRIGTSPLAGHGDSTAHSANLLVDAMAVFSAAVHESTAVPVGWMPSRHMVMMGDIAASAMV